MSKSGIRLIFAMYLIAVALQIRQWIAKNPGQWPKPAILLRSTAAFSLLGLLAQAQSEVAGALAVGLMLAMLVRDPGLLK